MKKISLLLLPVAAILLTACQKLIKGSEMPQLREDPGHLMRIVYSTERDGDADFLEERGLLKEEGEATYENYTNYIKTYYKSKVENEVDESFKYHIYKDSTYYYLEDNNGERKKAIIDAEGIEFGRIDPSGNTFDMFLVSQAQYFHTLMANYDNPADFNYFRDNAKLTRSGSTYTLTSSLEASGIKHEYSHKLTIENNYFTHFELYHTMFKGKLKISEQTSVDFTYVAAASAYPEEKMPNLGDYTTSFYSLDFYAFM